MLLPTAVIASSTWTNFSRLYQLTRLLWPPPYPPPQAGEGLDTASVLKYTRSPGLRVISRAAGILLSRTGPMRSIRCSRGGERAMPKGTVKKIVSDRGFGFIAADDGKEYFFHQSGVDTSLNFDSLRGGEAVSFDIEQSQKGPRANHVRAA